MGEKNQTQTIQAKALGDLVITETCPQCGQIHKWIWPNHPPLGEKGTKKCCGKTFEIKIVPESEYHDSEGKDEEDVLDELIEQAKEGDEKAKKILKVMSRENRKE